MWIHVFEKCLLMILQLPVISFLHNVMIWKATLHDVLKSQSNILHYSLWTTNNLRDTEIANISVREGISIFIWRWRFHTRKTAHRHHVYLYTVVLLLPLNTHKHTCAHSRWCKVMFLIKLQQLFLLSFWKWLDLDFIFHQKMFAQGFVICNEKITVP